MLLGVRRLLKAQPHVARVEGARLRYAPWLRPLPWRWDVVEKRHVFVPQGYWRYRTAMLRKTRCRRPWYVQGYRQPLWRLHMRGDAEARKDVRDVLFQQHQRLGVTDVLDYGTTLAAGQIELPAWMREVRRRAAADSRALAPKGEVEALYAEVTREFLLLRRPPLASLHAMLDAVGTRREFDLAVRALRHYATTSIGPTGETFRALVDAAVRAGRADCLAFVLANMGLLGLQPVVSSAEVLWAEGELAELQSATAAAAAAADPAAKPPA